MKDKVGSFDEEIIKKLNLNIEINTPIFIGDTNIEHMKNRHLSDYNKYILELSNIINNPDYVGLHKKNGSIEFVKEFKVDNEFVKVAVRCSGKNNYYARSIYVLNNNRVISFIQKGDLIKIN